MPCLFVSHGAPTLALDPGPTGEALSELGRELPTPGAILVISAHWNTVGPEVGNAPHPKTVHDFSGFPAELYELDYPAPGAPDLAERVRELLIEAGFPAKIDSYQGFDHGAWVPLRLLYPDAVIPVTQLSIQSDLSPAHHYRLGEALAPLRDEGILILASGSVTHNLGDVHFPDPGASMLDYVEQFRGWLAERIQKTAIDDLLDYRRQAPHAKRAHPTEDHLLPLFVALGAAAGSPARRLDAGVTYASLAMDAYVFG